MREKFPTLGGDPVLRRFTTPVNWVQVPEVLMTEAISAKGVAGCAQILV